MTKLKTLAIAASLAFAVLAAGFAWQGIHPDTVTVAHPVAVSGTLLTTRNYAITSTATKQQTKLVADAVESLHDEYLSFFAQSVRVDPNQKRLLLTLYKDQDEFKDHNKSSPWAEAYYLAPRCYAYFPASEKNPYHWMIHEATHQLNHEVAHFPASRWIGEGLATYFGTSTIRDGKLLPGRVDVDTYPIWWLAKLKLTGDFQKDHGSGKIIDLRTLISGVGDEKVNARYIGYWSLTHFLFHFENGRYAEKYRRLIATGGSIEDFEKIIGPVDRVEEEWYKYLQLQAEVLKVAPVHGISVRPTTHIFAARTAQTEMLARYGR